MADISPSTESTAHSPEKVLPPVQPPTAGFVVQLFVIPAMIVSIIAVVSLLFSWLAHVGGTPETLVKELERGGAHSWQTAYNLARELQKPGNMSLSSDEVLAGRLADLLERQLDVPLTSYASSAGIKGFEPNPRKAIVLMRVYLCRVLGEFKTPVVVPALVRAVTTEEYVAQDPDDYGDEQVRLSGIEAIAVLVGQIGIERLPDLDAVTSAIHQAASERTENEKNGDHRQRLRSAAAFALGVLGGQSDLDRLANLCHDISPNVRYNAATGLARHGDLRGQDVLLDMLTIDQHPMPQDKSTLSAQSWKQYSIISNALRAIEQLAHTNPSANLDVFRQTVNELLESNINGHLLAEVRRTHQLLESTEDS